MHDRLNLGYFHPDWLLCGPREGEHLSKGVKLYRLAYKIVVGQCFLFVAEIKSKKFIKFEKTHRLNTQAPVLGFA